MDIFSPLAPTLFHEPYVVVDIFLISLVNLVQMQIE